MKRLLLMVLYLFGLTAMALSQSANAVYLKDGSRVIGHILELDSLGGVRIMTQDGKFYNYSSQAIDNINWSYVIKEQGPGAIYRYGDMFRWKYNDT